MTRQKDMLTFNFKIPLCLWNKPIVSVLGKMMGNYSMVIYFVDLLNFENYIGVGMTACAPTHQRVRQKNCEQKASLDCITRLYIKVKEHMKGIERWLRV